MFKRRNIFISVSVIFTLGALTLFYGTQNNTSIQASPEHTGVKQATQTKFSYHEQVNIDSELLQSNIPHNFQELIKSGELAFVGKVKALEDKPYLEVTTAAYTMATINITQVLNGDQSFINRDIKILFAGEISRKVISSKVLQIKMV